MKDAAACHAERALEVGGLRMHAGAFLLINRVYFRHLSRLFGQTGPRNASYKLRSLVTT